MKKILCIILCLFIVFSVSAYADEVGQNPMTVSDINSFMALAGTDFTHYYTLVTSVDGTHNFYSYYAFDVPIYKTWSAINANGVDYDFIIYSGDKDRDNSYYSMYSCTDGRKVSGCVSTYNYFLDGHGSVAGISSKTVPKWYEGLVMSGDDVKKININLDDLTNNQKVGLVWLFDYNSTLKSLNNHNLPVDPWNWRYNYILSYYKALTHYKAEVGNDSLEQIGAYIYLYKDAKTTWDWENVKFPYQDEPDTYYDKALAGWDEFKSKNLKWINSRIKGIMKLVPDDPVGNESAQTEPDAVTEFDPTDLVDSVNGALVSKTPDKINIIVTMPENKNQKINVSLKNTDNESFLVKFFVPDADNISELNNFKKLWSEKLDFFGNLKKCLDINYDSGGRPLGLNLSRDEIKIKGQKLFPDQLSVWYGRIRTLLSWVLWITFFWILLNKFKVRFGVSS